ncbi:hypothetical protein QTP86_022739 [Hemibagrus guttatus]|nr:hypothetical protein QTP86_022739 [Hemibagrus guttatus]
MQFRFLRFYAFYYQRHVRVARRSIRLVWIHTSTQALKFINAVGNTGTFRSFHRRQKQQWEFFFDSIVIRSV